MADPSQPAGALYLADPFPNTAKKPVTVIPTPQGYAGAAPDPQAAKVAPWPAIDRYPVVLGSNLSLQTVSAVMRQASTGYRQPWVDVLSELIERDTHAHAVLAQRAMAVAGGRIDIAAIKSANPAEQPISDAIAAFCSTLWDAVPDRVQVLFGLLFQGNLTGLSGLENAWITDNQGLWRLARMHFIHTRRLAFPDPGSWDVRIWDQGGVGGAYAGGSLPTLPSVNPAKYPTTKLWGVRAADYPGKFVMYSPQLRGEYATREGLGRVLAWWIALKLMAARGAGAYIERFAKPWAWATFSTTDNGTPRAANDDDIAKMQAAVVALGTGSATGATLPDTAKINMMFPDGGKGGSGIGFSDFIAMMNAEISKAVLGQTFTVESGKYGSRATADVGKVGVNEIYKFDAAMLSETLRRDVFAWMVKLNFPQFQHLTPKIAIQLGDKPDPMGIMQVAQLGASIGLPIDGKALAERTGLPLIDPTDPNAIRLAFVSPVSLSAIDTNIAAATAALAPPMAPGADPTQASGAPGNGAPPGKGPPNKINATDDDDSDDDQLGPPN